MVGRRKLIVAKHCQGLGVEQGTQEETGLLGREEGRATAWRSGSVVEMVSESREVRRNVGTDGPARGDGGLWKGISLPQSHGRDGDILNQQLGPANTCFALKGTIIAP